MSDVAVREKGLQIYPGDVFGGNAYIEHAAELLLISCSDASRTRLARKTDLDELEAIAKRFDDHVTRLTNDLDRLRPNYRIMYAVFLKVYVKKLENPENLTEHTAREFSLIFWCGLKTLELNFDLQNVFVD